MPSRRASVAPILALLLLATAAGPLAAQPRTMGLLLNRPSASHGYTMFEAMNYPEVFLVDNRGRRVHSWVCEYPVAAMSYLLPNGRLLRAANPGGNPVFQAGGAGGLVREIGWDGEVLWEVLVSDEEQRQHHDVAALPNGNVLVIAWEYRSAAEAIAAGRNPAFLADALWPDKIVEIEPAGASGGNVVWEWHAWDHLVQDFDPTKENYGVVGDHPGLIDLNYPATASPDWLHFNAIAYNAELDQIMVSSPRFGELWIIDHGTTTEEAAGHTGGPRGKGGDLLYRWGNPQAYDRGTPADQQLFFPHDTHWIGPALPGAGNLLVFNNGIGRPESAYSSIEEIVSPVDAEGNYPDPLPGEPHGPPAPHWIHTATPPESLYSPFISGAQRLPNGNTLICAGPVGRLLEVDAAGQAIWEYVNPVNSAGPQLQGDPPSGNATFRAVRYPHWYWGFRFHNLVPGERVERYPAGTPAVSVAELPERPAFRLAPNFPNPFDAGTTIAFSLEVPATVRLDVHDVAGRRVATLQDGALPAGRHEARWRTEHLPSGVYHCTLRVGGETVSRTMTLVR